MLHPLNRLPQKGAGWSWTAQCEQASKSVKQQLTGATVLTAYNPDLQLRLSTDASGFRVEVVITDMMTNGEKRPIAFDLRTLTASEKNYAQIKREVLGIISGVKKIHQFRPFVPASHHKHLFTIYGSKNGVPTLPATRLQRWVLTLSSYSYSIEFKYSKKNATADSLSRLLCPGLESNFITQSEWVFTIDHLRWFSLTAKQLATATRRSNSLKGSSLDEDQIAHPMSI